MLSGIFSGQRGMAPAVFFVTVVWALLAVLLLTGTLLAARDINRQVKGAIAPELGRINKNTALIDLTAKTVKLSGAILTAAKPLSGQAAQIIKAGGSIDATAKSINQRVKPINATVRSLGPKIASIGSSVSSINSVVHSINSSVHSIYGSASSINQKLTSVNGNVGSILRTASTVDAKGIVAAADSIIDVAKNQGILPDFDGILGLVGDGGAGANSSNTVDGHANSIDCSHLLSVPTKDIKCGVSR